MSKMLKFTAFGLLVVFFWLAVAVPASGAPPGQAVYFTPTADTDGRILYTVKKNDTCISISLLNNVPMAELRRLNNLTGDDCPIREGQKLLLGTVAKTTPTIGPTPTPTPILPSPTPFAGTGEICVGLFEDINGNGMTDAGENALAGGAISLSDRKGKVNLAGSTSASLSELKCYTELGEGDYNISVAAPQGYNPTTSMNQPLKLMAGDRSILSFGAQQSLRAPPPAVVEEERSPMLAIAGGALILVGIGLGIYLRFLNRK